MLGELLLYRYERGQSIGDLKEASHMTKAPAYSPFLEDEKRLEILHFASRAFLQCFTHAGLEEDLSAAIDAERDVLLLSDPDRQLYVYFLFDALQKPFARTGAIKDLYEGIALARGEARATTATDPNHHASGDCYRKHTG
jgi:hypothetical protein